MNARGFAGDGRNLIVSSIYGEGVDSVTLLRERSSTGSASLNILVSSRIQARLV